MPANNSERDGSRQINHNTNAKIKADRLEIYQNFSTVSSNSPSINYWHQALQDSLYNQKLQWWGPPRTFISALSHSKDIYILKDLKRNFRRYRVCCAFSMTQLINHPMRITENSATLIDVILASNTSLVKNAKTAPCLCNASPTGGPSQACLYQDTKFQKWRWVAFQRDMFIPPLVCFWYLRQWRR